VFSVGHYSTIPTAPTKSNQTQRSKDPHPFGRVARALQLNLGCTVLRLLKGGAFDFALRVGLSAGDRCESNPVLSSSKTKNCSKAGPWDEPRVFFSVVGHDHIAREREAVTLAHFAQDLYKQILRARRGKQGQSAVAAARDEVEMTQSVPAAQTFGHSHRTKSPALEKRQGRGTPSSKS
jgi:hypothetical protein